MKSNIYIKLLSVTDKHDFILPFNVFSFMVKNFPMPKSIGNNRGWNNDNFKLGIEFLEAIRTSGYINYDKDLLATLVHGTLVN